MLQRADTFPISDILISKFQSYLDINQAEREALQNLSFRPVHFEPGALTVKDGDRPNSSQMVLEGLLGTSKTLGNGRQQTAAIHMKGDWPDLLSLHLGKMDADLRVLTPATVAFVEHADIRRLYRLHPRLGDVFWKFTLIEAAIFRHWVVNVGQRAAEPRLAHLLCEFVTRADRAGLKHDGAYKLTLTQRDLADCTGMSTVHVNRSLQSLRARQFITWERGILRVLDREGLAAMGDFWPDYLHLPAPDEKV